ncbi:hypothetical protein PYCC9005_001847 [Savitreella phatthalungensis]
MVYQVYPVPFISRQEVDLNICTPEQRDLLWKQCRVFNNFQRDLADECEYWEQFELIFTTKMAERLKLAKQRKTEIDAHPLGMDIVFDLCDRTRLVNERRLLPTAANNFLLEPHERYSDDLEIDKFGITVTRPGNDIVKIDFETHATDSELLGNERMATELIHTVGKRFYGDDSIIQSISIRTENKKSARELFLALDEKYGREHLRLVKESNEKGEPSQLSSRSNSIPCVGETYAEKAFYVGLAQLQGRYRSILGSTKVRGNCAKDLVDYVKYFERVVKRLRDTEKTGKLARTSESKLATWLLRGIPNDIEETKQEWCCYLEEIADDNGNDVYRLLLEMVLEFAEENAGGYIY